MKKLITIATVMMATMFAKAELTLYWQVAAESFSTAQYAVLQGIASDGSTVGIAGYQLIGIAEAVHGPLIAGFKSEDYTSFIVSLFDANETKLAESATYVYSDFSSYVYGNDITVAPPASPWTVSAFSIPEPTSGLLLLLGVAGLALKRKLA